MGKPHEKYAAVGFGFLVGILGTLGIVSIMITVALASIPWTDTTVIGSLALNFILVSVVFLVFFIQSTGPDEWQ